MKIDGHARTLSKAISWRVISLVVTFAVTWWVTGNTKVAVSVSFIDTLIKLLGYYYHERAWLKVNWGRVKLTKSKKKKLKNKQKKSKRTRLAKARLKDEVPPPKKNT